ncbi:tetratricopeptide (TPR) repeat protein [Streptosporangium becharense]|uniref:Tetratricopeptide (TPR) repeat protein n=1 Tax=Streptosporangium becharense TaxID=1816182 RepID=A0A7W9ILD7_9ACTN|nr:tetratricopeptide repeat protein [Streptosporangium becharense]MBB2911712.1 tetratricopeptide (TPR) repeat protein [Streptosporangium becharense]MBB5822470.1 tetratricopeptide (TPR) repeat protein [Streptosporangium becharense]
MDLAGHATLLVALASLWHGLTRHAEAHECARRAAELLGPASPEPGRDGSLADALIRMGDIERRQARYITAEAHLRRALALVSATDHERGATVRLALGVLCKETGRYGEAETYYRQALACLERHGDDHPLRADALHNLAGLAHARGDSGGEAHARAAIEIRQRVSGPHHDHVAADLAVLGAVLTDQGRHAEAEKALRRAMDIFRERLGADHYEVAVCQVNLAYLDDLQGRTEEAGRRYRDALRIKRLTLDSGHPEVRRLSALVEARSR